MFSEGLASIRVAGAQCVGPNFLAEGSFADFAVQFARIHVGEYCGMCRGIIHIGLKFDGV